MPSRQLRNRLTTDRTAPLLFPPQVQQLPSPLEVACHGHAEALLKVDSTPENAREPLPGHPSALRAAIQPLVPSLRDSKPKGLYCPQIPRDRIVREVASQLRH